MKRNRFGYGTGQKSGGETCKDEHAKIAALCGVHPQPLSLLPKVCSCGKRVRYNDTVTFNPLDTFYGECNVIGIDPDGARYLEREDKVYFSESYRGMSITVSCEDTQDEVDASVLAGAIMVR